MLLFSSLLVAFLACVSTLSVVTGSNVIKVSLKTSHRYGEISFENLERDVAEMQQFEKRGEESLWSIGNIYYQGEITVGTPNKTYNATFSNAVPYFMVMDEELCRMPEWEKRCKQHNEYACKKSSTCKDTGKNFTIYNNTISGTIVKDKLTIANITTEHFKILAVKNTTGSLGIGSRSYDAIVGLAYPAASEIKGIDPLIFAMRKQGQVKKAIIFMHYTNCTCGCKMNQLMLGGVDKQHCKGKFVYTDVTDKKYFTIFFEGAKLGSQTVIPPMYARVLAVVSLTFGPKTYMDEINKAIGAKPTPGSIWMVDCNKIQSMPNFTLTISGTSLQMTAYDYTLRLQSTSNCISTFVGIENMDHMTWGFSTLGPFCTVFDMGKDRIGFAPAK